MKVGIESAHSFGDCLFNLPLIEAISKHHNQPVTVAVRPQHQDAFYNVPYITEIVNIPDIHHGAAALKAAGCDKFYQITQNIKFEEFLATDPGHSLIDTPLRTGRQLGLPDFNQRPQFYPTESEKEAAASYKTNKRLIAVESVYRSGQSWSDNQAINMIIERHANDHIVWLSNEGAPPHSAVDDMAGWTRRELICLLSRCERFYSVGSGFFCASLALTSPPSEIICLWRDEYYHYERPLNQLRWHDHLTWVHSHSELSAVLCNN